MLVRRLKDCSDEARFPGEAVFLQAAPEMSLPIPNCRQRAGGEGWFIYGYTCMVFPASVPAAEMSHLPGWGSSTSLSFLVKSLLPCCLQDQFRLNLVCLSWYKMPQALSGSSSRRDTQNCVRRLPGWSLGVCSGGGGRTDLILFPVREAQVTFDRFHGP